MQRILLVISFLLLAVVVGVGPANAQVTSGGTITVVILDPNGAPMTGVTVTASAVDATTKRTGTTDIDGKLTFSALDPSALYVVTASMDKYKTSKFENVLVRSGQITDLKISLALGGRTEEITVTAGTPLVDMSNSQRGADITLRLTESLPTGRSYQSYLQLVPGVMPDDPKKPGNPASKAGINYSDIGGDVGVSTDNFYYFNGINVTDGQTGTFGANLNTEIIQEQKVLTGGIPAEFVGTAGLLSNVITKSGTNRFSGSANYFFQNDGLVLENKNSSEETFSSYDTAFTFGGPIVRDKAWFFGSYRRLNFNSDITALDTGAFLRNVDNAQDQGYVKGTWRPTSNDTIAFTFLNDPTDISGRIERDITNAQDRSRIQGGNRYAFNYSRIFDQILVEFAATKHDGEVSELATIREASNTIKYASTDIKTLADEQRGGFGTDDEQIRGTNGVGGTLQWLWKEHMFKGGLEFSRYSRFLDSKTVGADKAVYTSIASHLAGVSAADIVEPTFTQSVRFDPFNESDYNGFIATVNGLANKASFYSAFDTNGNGTITPDELGSALTYSSTAGNPNGQVNYFRIQQVQDGAQDFKTNGLSFFVQDTFRLNRVTLNVGVRAEQWSHYASEGTKIFTFNWGWAPRLSATYDLMGDGRHKVFAFYGRYYDPIRTNMTAFAGSISGRVREEQVFANGQWVNYRTRGGAVAQDAFFAPTTKTPYTDDTTIGYEVDLGRNMSGEVTYTNRRTRDILEDYDHNLYTINYPNPTAPNSLYLPPTYFGTPEQWADQIDVTKYPLTGGFPPANFFIATLDGGKRDYNGVEFTLRKRYADNWQGLMSYTFSDAKGNSNSDSNADFQGDVLWLDPDAPFQYGRQPGSIRHLFKMGGSYDFDFGLQLGFGYRWNSGTIASRTFPASGRNLPVRVPAAAAYEFGGTTQRWLAEDSVGSLTNPSWGQLDLRVQYILTIQQTKVEMFMDIFNVVNSQGSTRNQDLVTGAGALAFGDPIRFQDPARFFFGARFGF